MQQIKDVQLDLASKTQMNPHLVDDSSFLVAWLVGDAVVVVAVDDAGVVVVVVIVW